MNKIYEILLNKFSPENIDKIEEIKNDFLDFKYKQEENPEAELRKKHSFNKNDYYISEIPLIANFYCNGGLDLTLSYTTIKNDYNITIYITTVLNEPKEDVRFIEISIEKDKKCIDSLSYMVSHDIVTSASKNLKVFENEKHLFSTLLSYVGASDIKEKIDILNLVNDVVLDKDSNIVFVIELLTKLSLEKNIDNDLKIKNTI